MKNMIRSIIKNFSLSKTLSILLLFVAVSPGKAQLSITTANSAVTQSFDGLPTSGTGLSASGSIFSSGWSFLEGGTNANTTYDAGNGSSNAGNTYDFGTTSATDRAFGMLQSGSLTSIIGFKFTNNTGSTVTSLTIGYTGEVWRLSAGVDSINFSYQLSSVALNAASGWTTVNALTFKTPATGTAAAVDGNNNANRTVVGPITISGLSIANGTTCTFRWVDPTAASSAGMGIDDFTVTLVSCSAPTVSITGTTTGCTSVSLTATGTTGNTYAWSGGSSTSTAANTFSTSGTYTVTATNSGCTATASASVTVNNAPTASISGTTTACGTVSLTASGAAGGTYAWSGGSSPSTAANTFSSSGTYTVTTTNTCGTATASASVTVNPIPTLSVSGTNPDCNTVSLTASGTGASYAWSSGSPANAATNNFTSSGSYTVTSTLSGCTATATGTVTVNPTPTASISGTTTGCSTVSLTASGAGTGGTYAWSGGSSPSTAANTFTSSGTYTVTASNSCGTATATVSVTVNTPPSTPTFSGTTTACTSVSLTASSTSGSTFAWSGGSSPSTAANTFTTSGTYTVTATRTGCTATASQAVTVNTAPAITTQPSNTTVTTGSSASFTVVATGTGLTYQWRKGGSNISGANSATYTIASTVAGDAGSYDVVITGTCGTVTSSAATLTLTNFVYLAGDYRSTSAATDLSSNNSSSTATNNWEYFDGTSWGPTPGGKAPQNATTTPSRIIINSGSYVSGGGSNAKTYNNIVVLNNGWLDLVATGTPTADFIASGKTLEVQSGGFLSLSTGAQISMNSGSNFIVRSGGELDMGSANINNTHVIWNGIENFEPSSIVYISDWGFTGTGAGSLINVYGTISDNTSGYKFGTLTVDVNPGFSWVLVGGSLTLNLCDTLNITNASTNPITIPSNTSSPNVTIRRINHKSGIFGLTASYSGSATQTINILENLTSTGGTLKLFHNGGGTAGTINVNLAGNLTVGSSATFTNDATAGTLALNFNGTSTQYIDAATTVNAVPMNINSGAYVAFKNQDLTVNSNTGFTSVFTVKTGGTLDFGFAADAITPLVLKKTTSSPAGTNQFATQQGSTLKITSTQGIQQASGTTGNVQFTTSNKTFNQVATFWYVGRANQVTGDAITNTANGKIIIIDMNTNSLSTTLTQSTGFTNATTLSATGGKLDIRKGQFIETTSAFVNGSTGTLYMASGTLYQTPALSTSSTDLIPRMDGNTFAYSLTGGTIELNGAGAQTLRGSRTYFNIKFSGSNTSGTDYKNLSSSTTVNNSVIITGSTTIVDCIDASSNAVAFTGTGGLIMDNGRLRIKTLTTTEPELTGSASAYNITGGTVEFYGTGAATSQVLRGTDASGNIDYYNIDINATAANTSGYNVSPSASFGIKGAMTIFSPAVFQLDETESISNSGSFEVKPSATLKYGSPNGIKTSGTTTADGNIRITGTRTFPTTASYGFVGTGAMASGNGLPSTVANLYIQKGATADVVTLTNSVSATGTIAFTKGIIATGSNVLTAANGSQTAITGYDAPNSTGSYSDDKYVLGNLERTINTTGIYDFPVGDAVAGEGYNPVRLNIASGTGNATAKFVAGSPGSITVPKTDIGPCAPGKKNFVKYTNMTGEGWWNFTSSTGTTFSYDIYLHPNTRNANTKPNEAVVVTNNGVSTYYSATYRALKATSGTAGGTWPAGAATAGDPCTVSNTYYQIIGAGYSGFSDFAPGGGDGNTTALPVTMLYLNATAVDNRYIRLDWATASETNNAGFDIERSIDGVHFEKIGWMAGHDNSSTTITYTSDDKAVSPNQVYYYRLRQVDVDGRFEYSAIVSAVIVGKHGFVLEDLRPNPTTGKVQINVITTTEQSATIAVTDVLGLISINTNSIPTRVSSHLLKSVS